MRTLLFLFCCLCSTAALAQPKPMTPGAPHAPLQAMAGSWTVEMTTFTPDGKSQKATGDQEIRSTMGGLGVSYEYAVPLGPNLTIRGFGSQVWVPTKNKYQSAWADNLNPNGLNTGWATWDEKTKTMTEVLDSIGPDGKPLPVTMVTTIASKDSHKTVFTIKLPDGKTMKTMELAFTRKK